MRQGLKSFQQSHGEHESGRAAKRDKMRPRTTIPSRKPRNRDPYRDLHAQVPPTQGMKKQDWLKKGGKQPS